MNEENLQSLNASKSNSKISQLFFYQSHQIPVVPRKCWPHGLVIVRRKNTEIEFDKHTPYLWTQTVSAWTIIISLRLCWHSLGPMPPYIPYNKCWPRQQPNSNRRTTTTIVIINLITDKGYMIHDTLCSLSFDFNHSSSISVTSPFDVTDFQYIQIYLRNFAESTINEFVP